MKQANTPLRVAIASPYATVIPHFETELDIAQQHLDAGDKVDFLYCAGGLSNCDFNPERNQDRCVDCLRRRQMGLELLNPTPRPRQQMEFVPLEDQRSRNARPALRLGFETVESLIQYEIDGFDIGYAVLSSVVSLCRDPEPDLVAQQPLVDRFLKSANAAYWQTIDFLKREPIDRVYVFNGRFAAMRAILRACQKMKVDCLLHERGCDIKHYELFKNHLPHDLDAIEQAIVQRWHEHADDSKREQIAKSWFTERVDRVERGWHSFTKSQQPGRLPEQWSPEPKNISIFCSSDDEFVAIGKEWQNELYPNQVDAISRLATDMLVAQPQTKLYLRVHPNLINVENQRKRQMLALDFPNLTVIPPDDEIDSYALLKASDIVVSFGSSVGCEAIFWGRPSVLLGPCFYQNLGGVYRAKTHEHAIELLTSQLAPQPIEGALQYGFWLQTRGHAHKHYLANDFFTGHFQGESLYARPPKTKFGLKKLGKRLKSLIKKTK